MTNLLTGNLVKIKWKVVLNAENSRVIMLKESEVAESVSNVKKAMPEQTVMNPQPYIILDVKNLISTIVTQKP